MKKILILLGCLMLTGGLFAQSWAEEKAMDPDYGPAQAIARDTVNYSDTIVGGPSWDRPFADCSCCSGLGPVTYHVQEFTVDTAGDYDLSSVQDGFDGYMLIYQDSFDPLAQDTNCVAGDDDGPGGIGTSEVTGLTLAVGTTYLFVTTGFAAGDEGTFTNTITGPGIITLGGGGQQADVPTLGQWGLIGFILLLCGAGVFFIRRR